MASAISPINQRLPIPVVLFVLALAFPPELSIELGGLRLSAYRVVILVFLIPCIFKSLRSKEGHAHLRKLLPVDALIVFHALWAMLALVANEGVGQGIESGGIYMIETVGSYFIARAYIRTASDFHNLARLMLWLVAVLLMFAILESLSGQHLIRDLARGILGGPPLPFIEPRLGLHRAFTSFDHPILYGIFCGSAFGMAYYMPVFKNTLLKLAPSLLVSLATFFSLSSGAFSLLFVQGFLVSWDRITKSIQGRWAFLIGSVATVWLGLTLISNRGPIKVFLAYFTFSPSTGYNRLRIWEYGSAEVGRHPVFGIGLGEWERPAWMVSGSMDNFWLATAVRYGFPAFLFFALAVAYVIWKQVATAQKSEIRVQSRTSWIVTMAGLSLAACTVHFWNSLFCFFCFFIGAGVWLSVPAKVSRIRRPPYQNEITLFQNERRRLFPSKKLQPTAISRPNSTFGTRPALGKNCRTSR